MSHPLHDPNKRLRQQIREIRKFFKVAVGPPGADADDSVISPRFLAEQGYLLVREGRENEDLVARHVRVRHGELPRREHGVVRLPIAEDVAIVVERLGGMLEFRNARPRVVTPNHLLTITPVNGCPADEPMWTPLDPTSLQRVSVPDPIPDELRLLVPGLNPDRHAGAGVDVLVVDTGLVDDVDTHSWLNGTTGGPPVRGDSRRPVEDPLKLYYGHGTFIAGVLRCVAPGTRVDVSNALCNAGTISEFDLGGILLRVLDDWARQDGKCGWPDIICLSAGAPTSGLDEPLQGLDEFLRQLDVHPETVLVCAAGNDGERSQPFWPAAYAPRYGRSRAVVAVGALRQDGKGRACFTNYGDWVTVYAPGERLVNAFTSGKYRNVHDNTPDCRYYPGKNPGDALYLKCTCMTAHEYYHETYFKGLAAWSGTSFATPIIAGHIARRMTEGTGRTSREAAHFLLDECVDVVRDAGDHVMLPVLRDALGHAMPGAIGRA